MSQRKWTRLKHPIVSLGDSASLFISLPGYETHTLDVNRSVSLKRIADAIRWKAELRTSLKKRALSLSSLQNYTHWYFWSASGRKTKDAILFVTPNKQMEPNLCALIEDNIYWLVHDAALENHKQHTLFHLAEPLFHLFELPNAQPQVVLYPEQAPRHLLEYLLS